MKKVIIYIAVLLVSVSIFGQNTQVNPSATKNYVHKIVYKKGVEQSALGTVGSNDKIETISYFDGLGRPIQNIGVRVGGVLGSTQETDIITHIEYDAYGRQAKEYLPVPFSDHNGKYKTINKATDINDYYYQKYTGEWSSSSAANPYSQKEFEASPLNRALKQAAPGEDWKLGSGHEIVFEYSTNTASSGAEGVRNYTVTLGADYTPTLDSNAGFYAVNTLYKTVTKDENHSGTSKLHTIEEFKDKQGRVVLKRTYATIGSTVTPYDTYYVYNDLGNLTFVLPPKVVHDSSISSTELNELCYQYKYDQQNRLIEKKIPGKGWEYIVYNNLDQPIMTQDENLKAQSKWLFTKYDAFGRIVYTGMYSTSNSRVNIQNYVNSLTVLYESKGTTFYNYTNNVYPVNITSNDILTVNYYDDYTFDKAGLTIPSTSYGEPIINYNNASSTKIQTKGLTTGSKVKILGEDHWITTVTGYDEHNRPIWIGVNNSFLKTTDIVESKLKNSINDISGQVYETKTTHKKIGKMDVVTIEKFTYDHAGKVLTQSHQVNNRPVEMIAINTYDELGQLVQKKVGGTVNDELQVVDYGYNIRGWLTDINKVNNIGSTDLFAFNIRYNSPNSGTALYNGNISQIQWKTKSTDQNLKFYRFYYDALNRLIDAQDNMGSNYRTWAITYDKNGNLERLYRRGHLDIGATSFGDMDKLFYYYETNSNKLRKVVDDGDKNYGFVDGVNQTIEYTYDSNGNMKTDANKGITNINYNHLNLPVQVTINGQNIDYIYDAGGTKLRKTVNGTTTDYSGNYVYENNNLQFFNHPEGYVTPSGSSFTYVYQYKDHLGNVRLSYADSDGNGTIAQSEIIEENNYYPFGLKHKGYNEGGATSLGNNVAQRYKFGGKELQDEIVVGGSLEWYDVTARNYDPALGRWMNVDPLAEKMENWSPFNYSFNSPIYFTDPDGMAPQGPDKIINPRQMVLSNKTLIEKLKQFDLAVARISGKDVNSFSFVISGGDRYRGKDGKIYSSSNNKVIKGSAKRSQHIYSEGATGVDLKFADGISYDVLKKAAKETGFRIDPSGKYRDHFHLDLRNDRSKHELVKGNIPQDFDFAHTGIPGKIQRKVNWLRMGNNLTEIGLNFLKIKLNSGKISKEEYDKRAKEKKKRIKRRKKRIKELLKKYKY